MIPRRPASGYGADVRKHGRNPGFIASLMSIPIALLIVSSGLLMLSACSDDSSPYTTGCGDGRCTIVFEDGDRAAVAGRDGKPGHSIVLIDIEGSEATFTVKGKPYRLVLDVPQQVGRLQLTITDIDGGRVTLRVDQ